MTDSSVTGRNQNHSDVRDESARDNDPLFELSRIFGFDEPAEQKNIYTPQAEPELSAEMSLERELMADFDADFAADFAAEPEQATGNYQPEPAANNYQSEPAASNYQPLQSDYRPAAPAVAESRPYQHNVEPHFSGYAPLQRAYAPQTPAADDYAVQQPAAEPEATQYYAELDYAPAAPEVAQDSYYAAYSDLPQAPAFSEPVQEDYFSSFEDELSQTLAPEPALQPVADTSAFDFSDIGREPQQEFIAPSYSDAFAQSKAFTAASQQTPASFEDELSFLLQDPAPVAAPVQPAAPRYEESAPAPTAYQPVFDKPVAPQTDFAPLFDAPAPEVAPVVTDYDPYKSAAQESYANERPAALEQIDDEFFDAPDLNSLRNRPAAPQTNWEENQAEETAVKSFADLFGAGSQGSGFAEPEAEANYQPEQVAAYEEPQGESFDFADDFFNAEPANTVAEEPTYAPEPVAPLAHNAVRGYSSYTFGAATPAAAGAETFVSPSVEQAAPAPYAAPAPLAATPSYEQPVATDDFFSNDDFDFSFDEEIQQENDFSISDEDDLKFELPEEPELPAYEPVQSSVRKAFTPAPEIETVVVSENKVEQTQALDLPEVSYGDEAKETGLNSLESEFAEIFSTISVNEAATPDTTSEADKAFENILQDNFADYHIANKADAQDAHEENNFGTLAGAAAGLAGAAAAGAAMRGSAPQARADATGNATQDDYYNHWAAQGAQSGALAGSQPNDFDTYNLGENFARDEDEYTEVRPHEKAQQRKPLFWAGVAAAALIVVGGGYYMLKSGGVVGGEPEVLRADSQPVKVQPENPGGAVVPNQDKAVYDQVSGTKPAAPEQKTLINTEEEPVDVGLLAGQDVEEDRLMNEEAGNSGNALPAANNTQETEQRELITPRTVKTMVVRADGTIVPGEAPAAPSEPATTDNGLDEASRLISQSAVPERLGSDKPATSAQNAAAPRVVQTQTFTASGEQAKPTAAPVVPSRPVEQPVNVVGNVERPAQNQALQQVANANVTTSNAPAGTWFIQVASQPSAELAQKNYANLTSRYGNIIGGKGVDIKKADIPGKGTYYRVRIPGGSKAEAAALCDRLKSAGGSCFPTL